MLMLVLFGISFLSAIALFVFGWIWYSPKLAGKVMMQEMSSPEKCGFSKLSLLLEFLSCLLISLGVSFVFGPFDWYFGLINSAVLIVAILLPFAISDFIWCEKKSMKLSSVKFGHRALQLLISFTLIGFLNSVILPRLLSNGIF